MSMVVIVKFRRRALPQPCGLRRYGFAVLSSADGLVETVGELTGDWIGRNQILAGTGELIGGRQHSCTVCR